MKKKWNLLCVQNKVIPIVIFGRVQFPIWQWKQGNFKLVLYTHIYGTHQLLNVNFVWDSKASFVSVTIRIRLLIRKILYILWHWIAWENRWSKLCQSLRASILWKFRKGKKSLLLLIYISIYDIVITRYVFDGRCLFCSFIGRMLLLFRVGWNNGEWTVMEWTV